MLNRIVLLSNTESVFAINAIRFLLHVLRLSKYGNDRSLIMLETTRVATA